MLPRSWFALYLLIILTLTACQSIKLIEDPSANQAIPALTTVPAITSTTTSDATGCPQITDQPLDLIVTPQWQVGQIYHYKAKYSHNPIKNNELKSTITTSFKMRITVIEETEDGYILEWDTKVIVPEQKMSK